MQPFLSLCVIFRDNIDSIDDFLKSVDGYFDEFVFTDTGSVDGTRAKIEAFLSTRLGRVNEFTWVDDFAKARQASFDAATGRWRMFLDTDDTLMNGKELKPFLVKCEAARPQMEACFFGYDYAQNEYLDTMRVCRFRDGWRWTDAIHERLEFQKFVLPQEAFGRTRDVFVKHKYKSDAEKSAAIRRNGVIARREYKATTDAKYRARLARTIAMEMKMDGKAPEAIPFLEELYGPYHTYPEGRQAAADLMKAYLMISASTAAQAEPKKVEAAQHLALDWAKKAGPSYEAITYHSMKDYPNALKAVHRAEGRGQQTTHEGLLFEKGAQYIAGAESALRMEYGPNGGADVAERLINCIPAKFRNDRVLVESVQAMRWNIDRITIVVPFTPQPFDETGGGGMLGGSEEAVLYLSEALVKLGRKVRIYGQLPPQRIPGLDSIGRDWQPYSSFDINGEHGNVIIWRAWQLALNLLEARMQGQPMPGVQTCWMWLHDYHCGVPAQLMEPLSKALTGVIALSDFHADAVRKQGFTGLIEKLSNGIVESDFVPFYSPEGRDKNRVIYSSDPSRGLYPLLKMWPEVKAACPDAFLDIYYDWSMFEAMQPDNYLRIKQAYDEVKHLSVTHHGGVDHATLHSALKNCNVWAYSHFESPLSETFCISAVKALAAGATVLTVPNGALAEVCAGDAILITDIDSYKSALIDKLKNPDPFDVRRDKANRARERFGWKAVAEKFSAAWTARPKEIVIESPKPAEAAA